MLQVLHKIFSALKLLLVFFALQSSFAIAQNQFQVSLLRASPGNLAPLIDAVKSYKKTDRPATLIMRHSQGDHWDLMLLSQAPKDPLSVNSFGKLASFQHDFLVSSDANWKQVSKLAKKTNLFHIEMFQAANGQYKALAKQRVMENNYLVATGRQANLVFTTIFGSDTDIFTLGFYPDLMAFAKEPDLPAATFEKAAVNAGFKSRSDIGLYLRQFLVSHQDTLATQVY